MGAPGPNDCLAFLQVYYDTVRKASYAWQASSGTFISFDNAAAVQDKVAYIKQKGLGGAMVWALGTDDGSLWKVLASNL